MTTAEIKALVGGVKSFGRPVASDVPYLVEVIETLLARQAEGLTELRTAMIHSNPELIFKHTMNAITILNPENEI